MLRMDTCERIVDATHSRNVQVYVAQHIVGIFGFIFMQIFSKYWNNEVNDYDYDDADDDDVNDDDDRHHGW